jgi:hypothetical protein
MLSATSSNMNSNAGSSAEEVPSLRPSTTYLCISCQVSFPDGQQQRIHMKEPWQYVWIASTVVKMTRVDTQTVYTTSSGALPHYRQYPAIYSIRKSGRYQSSPNRLSAIVATTRKRRQTMEPKKAHRHSNAYSALSASQATPSAWKETSSTCIPSTPCLSPTRIR